MSDKKKLIILVAGVALLYILFYFQSDISSGITNPVNSLKNVFKKNPDTTDLSEIWKDDADVEVKVIEEENAVIQVVESASPAVVSVVRTAEFFDYRRGPVRSEDSIGTGFIVDGKEGFVFTNKHVVSDEDVTYSVVLGENEARYDVTEITRSPVYDFAILKIDTKGNELPELKLGDSDHLKVGQTAIAIGNALGEFGNSVTKGIVSGLGRGIIAQSGAFGETESLDDVIQTDAALNPGNSGGPLLNIAGQVIGINVAISEGAENIGFAIPVNTLKSSIAEFEESGQITRPFLGVEAEVITQELAQAEDLPMGAYVLRVVSDSPASDAGIERGDIITRINGVRLDDENNTLSKVILTMPTDKDIEITVDRDGREMNLQARLRAMGNN